ncbi:MAG: sigma-70 family RNA polymerase sigma factor, partial [Nitrososphaerales archaeon]
SHPVVLRPRRTGAMTPFESVSDATLVVAIGRWQEAALAEVYRRHGAAVHNLARRVIRSSELADEVTQEVFVDLWNRPEQFDATRGSLRTMLVTKTHGRAVDVIRSEQARLSREQRSAQDSARSGYDVEHYAWDLAIADQVNDAVENLPEDERLAIEMAYFDGMTYREVAAALEAPEGTIKSRIRTGLRRLRSVLVNQGVEAP